MLHKKNTQAGAVLAEYISIVFLVAVGLLAMVPSFMTSASNSYESRTRSLDYTNRGPLVEQVVGSH